MTILRGTSYNLFITPVLSVTLKMEIARYIICSDGQLIAMSLAGDTCAFDHLYGRYRPAILEYLIRRGNINRDLANDLVQDVFIKVFLRLDSYDDRYSFGQWVYVIARNVLIDFMRKHRTTESLDEDARIFQNGDPAPDPEESYIDREVSDAFRSALGALKPSYRRVMELRLLDGYSYNEIAGELGIPVNTVKTQIRRAKLQLSSESPFFGSA